MKETPVVRKKNHGFRIIFILCMVMSAVLGYTGAAYADESETKTVRVGYYENEVFQEGAQDGTVKTGYAYEYYRKLSEYTGWKYEYVYGGFGDLYQMLLDGEIDLLAGLAWREERADLISYPKDIMGHESYYLVKHDVDTEISADPATMKGCKIGVLDSAMVSVLNRFLEENRVEAEVVTYGDHVQLFGAFDSHEVDILAAESDGAHGREHSEVLTVFGTSDYYLCVNKNRQDILEELNTAQTLLAAEEPNYLNNLSAKYYSVSVTARAFSQAEREWMNAHNTLRVGYLDNYLPYSDTDDQGEVTGIVKDMIPALLKSVEMQDIQVTYHGYRSYDDMIASIDSGETDVVFPVGGGLYYSEENGIYQSNPVSSSPAELVYKGEFSEETTAHFAVNENNRMQYYFVRTNYPDAKIDFYPSSEDCLRAVLAGKAGCVTLNGLRANDILRNREFENLSIYQTSYNDSRCFGVEIGNEGLLKLLNRGINVLGSDYAKSISFRYTGGLYSYDFVDVLRDNLLLFTLIFLAIVGLIVFLLVRDMVRTKKEIKAKELANRAKTAFLNNMSHDMRTPMNAIVGFTALASSHIDNKEQVQDYLGKISVSSRHLLSLINDVLDMSRIESGKVTIETSEVHLPDVIHDLSTIIQSSIAAKKIGLFIEIRDVAHEDIVTDKLRLNQVLLNILSNAIKFTPEGGTISFRVRETACTSENTACFEFRIKDNGIGMSEEFQKTIFDAFTRERTSTVSGIQGTGLGMSITKNIVDMMGGTITVSSKEGEGSEFVVNFPFRIGRTSGRYEPLPEMQGIRALVADDDADTCISLTAMLEEIGLRPEWTGSGKEAVKMAKEALTQGDEYKVYIIDWLMPDQNGIETVRSIRQEIGEKAPIIIFTAYDWTEIEEEARAAGATAFCSKPLFMSELRDVLSRKFLESQDAVEEKKRDEIPDLSGKRVLLVEDNEMNQMIAEAILSEAGLAVEIAGDGVEALEKYDEVPVGYYDIILMDIQMPRMDGYETAKRIRALEDKAKASIPIVAVTANAFAEDKATAMEAGMNGHLAKPYDVPAIMEMLKSLLL